MSFEDDPRDEYQNAPCPACGAEAVYDTKAMGWLCTVCTWSAAG
jgi:ribosomal protein L37AE/L43A